MKYYDEIKNELIKNEITKKVKDYSKNRSDLNTYYNVGKLLSEAGKHYGDGIIKEYSKRLTNELGKGYTMTNLKYFRQFYVFLKSHTVCDQLSWSHYRTLLSLSNENEIEYYTKIIIVQNLSVRELRQRIKNNEYERLDESTKEKLKVPDLVKNQVQIRNTSCINEISEKVLQKLILEDIPSFLDELGNGFTFVRNEYKIKVGNRYNYIDLLLFNYEFNCFVVVELKVTELKKEHIGQIEVYMNYIDKNIKSINQNKTIGIIICKKENKYVIEYCSDDRIISRKYELV